MPRTLSKKTLVILKFHDSGKSSKFIEKELGLTQQAVSAAINRHYEKVINGEVDLSGVSLTNLSKTTQHNQQHNTINNTTQSNIKNSHKKNTPTVTSKDMGITTQHNQQHNTINNTTQSNIKNSQGLNGDPLKSSSDSITLGHAGGHPSLPVSDSNFAYLNLDDGDYSVIWDGLKRVEKQLSGNRSSNFKAQVIPVRKKIEKYLKRRGKLE